MLDREEIKKAKGLIQFNQNVHVALVMGLIAGYGAKNVDRFNA